MKTQREIREEEPERDPRWRIIKRSKTTRPRDPRCPDRNAQDKETQDDQIKKNSKIYPRPTSTTKKQKPRSHHTPTNHTSPIHLEFQVSQPSRRKFNSSIPHRPISLRIIRIHIRTSIRSRSRSSLSRLSFCPTWRSMRSAFRCRWDNNYRRWVWRCVAYMWYFCILLKLRRGISVVLRYLVCSYISFVCEGGLQIS